MSLLVFGATGQVGLDLQRQMGGDAPYLVLGRDRADLTDPDACAAAILRSRPAVVINVAAARPGTDPAQATCINATAPGRMAEACAQIGAGFVHLSTAEVFDGRGETARRPGDPAHPATPFGQSKWAGEEAIRSSGAAHVILRTSWVISAHGTNLLTALLQRAANEPRIPLPADQIGAPTCAYDLATACQLAALRLVEDKSLSGTYHYQGKPQVSLAEAGRLMLAAAGMTAEVVEVETGDAPKNLRLDGTLTEAQLGLRAPDWQKGLRFILNDLM